MSPDCALVKKAGHHAASASEEEAPQQNIEIFLRLKVSVDTDGFSLDFERYLEDFKGFSPMCSARIILNDDDDDVDED